MNSDNEYISSKNRKRSDPSYSYSVSSERSRSKSKEKSHKKKSKKSKKKHKSKKDREHKHSRDHNKTRSGHSRSRNSSRSKSEKSKKTKKSHKKHRNRSCSIDSRSRSKSGSVSSDEGHEHTSNRQMGRGLPMMYPGVNPYMPHPYAPRGGDPRFMMRPHCPVPHGPPMYNPNPQNDFYSHGRGTSLRPPAPISFIPKNPFPMQEIPENAPPDKIVKDQNFLNSDDKLFDSIINSDMNIRSLYADVQISETYAGTTLYKTIKKLIYDPTTVIFDNNEKSYGTNAKIEKPNDEVNTIYYPKNGEVLKCVFEDIMFKNNDKKRVDMGDQKDIRTRLLKSLQIKTS